MFNHFVAVRKWLAKVMLVLSIVLGLTLAVGGLVFNLDVVTVASWFAVALLAIFALVFVYTLILYTLWFWFGKPCPVLLCILGLAIVLGIAYVFAKVLGGPVFDIGTLVSPILAFLQ